MLTSDEEPHLEGVFMVTGISGRIMYNQSGINHNAVEPVAERAVYHVYSIVLVYTFVAPHASV